MKMAFPSSIRSCHLRAAGEKTSSRYQATATLVLIFSYQPKRD